MTGVVGVTSILCFYFLHEFVATILLAESYRTTSFLMPWIASGFCMFNIGMVFELRIRAFKRTSLLLIAHGIVAFLAVVVVYFLGRKFGLLGIAVAAPIYYGVFAIVCGLLSQTARTQPISIDFSSKRLSSTSS